MTESNSTDPTPPQTSRHLVHLVEPCLPLLEILVLHLLDEGYDVKPFVSHEIALQDFASSNPRPQLLITNYGSGACSGVELMNRSVRLQPGLKVILCSGRPEIPEKIAASPSDFRFLPKPFPLPVLDFTIQSLIGKPCETDLALAHAPTNSIAA